MKDLKTLDIALYIILFVLKHKTSVVMLELMTGTVTFIISNWAFSLKYSQI